ARNRRLGLLHHAADEAIGPAFVEAGGIDRRERKIAETTLTFAAVAGYARPVIDQREALADQPVEQRRLADIRPSNNGKGEGHGMDLGCANGAALYNGDAGKVSVARPARALVQAGHWRAR